MYQHQFHDNSACDYPTGKVLCVGRNYAAHAKELNNPVPKKPIIFIKPNTAVVSFCDPIVIPRGRDDCHFEAELSVLIGNKLSKANPEQAAAAIAGFGIGLDLTLRDLQSELKNNGHPWEVAKAFDGACPLTPFIASAQVENPEQLGLKNTVNGKLRQIGHVQEMINPIKSLLALMSHSFTLLPGDVVLTGTPAGVGPLTPGDKITLQIFLSQFTSIAERHDQQVKEIFAYHSEVAQS